MHCIIKIYQETILLLAAKNRHALTLYGMTLWLSWHFCVGHFAISGKNFLWARLIYS